MVARILSMQLRILRAISLSRTCYIGAGTGSMIIQVAIASALGAAVALRLYWSKIKKLFSRKQSEVELQQSDLDE
jgi:precorrin-6B methylase 2